MKLDTEFIPPERAAPPVVVAAGQRDPHAFSPQGTERVQGPVGAAWDDRPVLEPELEQVSIDDQVVAEFRNGLEESAKQIRRFLTTMSDVGIGDDYRSWRRHGAV
jgi:hypothetical protein